MARLTAAQRRALPLSDFAVPSKAPGPGSYPIEDAKHRALAKGRSKGKPVARTVMNAVDKKTKQAHARSMHSR